ncbi:bifunctional biotin--[acetyl-CoA-carboxylase] ligase/biotin operon repressor BirA [Kangiella koreensis]|uniref:Bifunctional ligase/repressor BirA n=1 Tax=Kangiella koreensis (strain DSM 16069 / JCM 12317 / KCTC 12182 / SW-125) TaxID=523791 RepID=C7R859_KANKD|nr:bifunctional biotin--[acetyl-CoA-carboxylase] ligase/biotin operon repressor BirA [Kangiella koreensis]ACV25841.1 biotin/acetyl-CoA-carboxylase ligase [Kangiella koreensis DSM 16069]
MTEHRDQQLRQLISLLKDGNFHSGQKLADELSVSRAYVWKLMQQLEALGLEFESVTRKGYRLIKSLQLLDAQSLQQEMVSTGLEDWQSEVLLLTDSTNEQLKGAGFCHKKVLAAEYQSAGRGRRGRQWVSPLASNLYWSVGWQTQMPVQQLGGLSLVVGLAIIKALQSLDIEGVQLKWPNDIRYQGKKLGGILIELSGDVAGALQVVIGVGLNMQMGSTLAQSIEQEWMNVNDLAPDVSRQQVLAKTIVEFNQALELFEQKGFAAFQELWQEVDECFGQKVSILQQHQELKGIGAGVDDTGALLLQTGQGVIPIYAGEVSLRFRA